MNIRFINQKEKKKMLDVLKEQFGIQELPYALVETGKEKIRAFSGSITEKQIKKISELANLEIVGIYLLKQERIGDLRLSFDATHLLKSQISKSIIEINEEQLNKWMHGNDLELNLPKGTYVISHESDFLGCGKSNGKILFNYVPKDRRLKSKL